jgi:hypothetical protein
VVNGSWGALGGLLAGVGGAVLIAAVVVGRGEVPNEVRLERLHENGGVLWVHVENYERPSFERANPLPERTISDTWTLVVPGSGARWIGAGHTIDGELIGSSRSSPGLGVGGDSRRGAVIAWPEPRGESVAMGDGSCDEVNVQMERLPSEADGSFVCVEPYPRPATGSGSSAGSPDWPIALDVVSVRKEAHFGAEGGLESVRFVASLEDGSEVVIARQRFHMSILPLWDWGYIEELVFGG